MAQKQHLQLHTYFLENYCAARLELQLHEFLEDFSTLIKEIQVLLLN